MAVLAEDAEKRFGHPFHRLTIRLFALRHGYYQGRPEESLLFALRPQGQVFFSSTIVRCPAGYRLLAAINI
ncbi:MAG: hypothetical protein N3B16_11755 [Candidatus Aminicenantes bacterium]|nr:hypothetical protein [Candidatus Aminicenantes bacterium]